jgi:hypothetical protein
MDTEGIPRSPPSKSLTFQSLVLFSSLIRGYLTSTAERVYKLIRRVDKTRSGEKEYVV